MKVKFNANLGSRNAAALGLKHEDCTVGSVCDVSAEQLVGLKRFGDGVATEVADAPRAAAKSEPETDPKKK